MIYNFDNFDRFEVPELILCNPDDEQIGVIVSPEELSITINFNEISELRYKIYNNDEDFLNDDGSQNTVVPNIYRLHTERREVLVAGIGYFIITDVSEMSDSDGIYKTITAKSCEYELNNINVPYINDTYRLFTFESYSALSNYERFRYLGESAPTLNNQLNVSSDDTGRFFNDNCILYELLCCAPSWRLSDRTIKKFASSGAAYKALAESCRTFESEDKTVYSFLKEDIQSSYDCFVSFNIFDRTIDIFTYDDVFVEIPYVLSNSNILSSCEVSTTIDDYVNALKISGGTDDVLVQDINPNGTSIVYNFDHDIKTGIISGELKNAIEFWKDICSQKNIKINTICGDNGSTVPINIFPDFYSKDEEGNSRYGNDLYNFIKNSTKAIEAWIKQTSEYNAQKEIPTASIPTVGMRVDTDYDSDAHVGSYWELKVYDTTDPDKYTYKHYNKGNIVIYEDKVYMCTQDHDSSTSTFPSIEGSPYWSEYVGLKENYATFKVVIKTALSQSDNLSVWYGYQSFFYPKITSTTIEGQKKELMSAFNDTGDYIATDSGESNSFYLTDITQDAYAPRFSISNMSDNVRGTIVVSEVTWSNISLTCDITRSGKYSMWDPDREYVPGDIVKVEDNEQRKNKFEFIEFCKSMDGVKLKDAMIVTKTSDGNSSINAIYKGNDNKNPYNFFGAVGISELNSKWYTMTGRHAVDVVDGNTQKRMYIGFAYGEDDSWGDVLRYLDTLPRTSMKDMIIKDSDEKTGQRRVLVFTEDENECMSVLAEFKYFGDTGLINRSFKDLADKIIAECAGIYENITITDIVNIMKLSCACPISIDELPETMVNILKQSYSSYSGHYSTDSLSSILKSWYNTATHLSSQIASEANINKQKVMFVINYIYDCVMYICESDFDLYVCNYSNKNVYPIRPDDKYNELDRTQISDRLWDMTAPHYGNRSYLSNYGLISRDDMYKNGWNIGSYDNLVFYVKGELIWCSKLQRYAYVQYTPMLSDGTIIPESRGYIENGVVVFESIISDALTNLGKCYKLLSNGKTDPESGDGDFDVSILPKIFLYIDYDIEQKVSRSELEEYRANNVMSNDLYDYLKNASKWREEFEELTLALYYADHPQLKPDTSKTGQKYWTVLQNEFEWYASGGNEGESVDLETARKVLLYLQEEKSLIDTTVKSIDGQISAYTSMADAMHKESNALLDIGDGDREIKISENLVIPISKTSETYDKAMMAQTQSHMLRTFVDVLKKHEYIYKWLSGRFGAWIETLQEQINNVTKAYSFQDAFVKYVIDKYTKQSIQKSYDEIKDEALKLYYKLTRVIKQQTYTNQNIIITDVMSFPEIYAAEHELYNDGLSKLSKLVEPSSAITIEASAFMFDKSYADITKGLFCYKEDGKINKGVRLGGTIYCELPDGSVPLYHLSSITVDYSEPSCSITFGNRINSNDPSDIFADLESTAAAAADIVASERIDWGIKSLRINELMAEKDADINTTARAMANSVNNVSMDSSGIKCFAKNIVTNEDMYGFWGANGTLMFQEVDENGERINKTAIGRITKSNGEVEYGFYGDTIVANTITADKLAVGSVSKGTNLIRNGSFEAVNENGHCEYWTTSMYGYIIPTTDKPNDQTPNNKSPIGHRNYRLANSSILQENIVLSDKNNYVLSIYAKADNNTQGTELRINIKSDKSGSTEYTEVIYPTKEWKRYSFSREYNDGTYAITISRNLSGSPIAIDGVMLEKAHVLNEYSGHISELDSRYTTINDNGVTVYNGNITIFSGDSTTSSKVFFADSGGNLTLTGTIYANSGSIGGWSINSEGIASINEDGIYTHGISSSPNRPMIWGGWNGSTSIPENVESKFYRYADENVSSSDIKAQKAKNILSNVNFFVNQEGKIFANNAYIKGVIRADELYIGKGDSQSQSEYVTAEDYINEYSPKEFVGSGNSFYAKINGNITKKDDKIIQSGPKSGENTFYVTAGGHLYSKSAEIESANFTNVTIGKSPNQITIDANGNITGAKFGNLGFSSTGSTNVGSWVVSNNGTLHNNANNISSNDLIVAEGRDKNGKLQQFVVEKDGSMYASNATITGKIYAVEGGSIGGWTIGKTTLYTGSDQSKDSTENLMNANDNFIIGSNGDVEINSGTFKTRRSNRSSYVEIDGYNVLFCNGDGYDSAAISCGSTFGSSNNTELALAGSSSIWFGTRSNNEWNHQYTLDSQCFYPINKQDLGSPFKYWETVYANNINCKNINISGSLLGIEYFGSGFTIGNPGSGEEVSNSHPITQLTSRPLQGSSLLIQHDGTTQGLTGYTTINSGVVTVKMDRMQSQEDNIAGVWFNVPEDSVSYTINFDIQVTTGYVEAYFGGHTYKQNGYGSIKESVTIPTSIADIGSTQMINMHFKRTSDLFLGSGLCTISVTYQTRASKVYKSSIEFDISGNTPKIILRGSNGSKEITI